MKYSREIDLRDRDELLDKLWQVNIDTYTQKQLDYLADLIEEFYADIGEIPDLTEINDFYRFQADEILEEAGFFEEEEKDVDNYISDYISDMKIGFDQTYRTFLDFVRDFELNLENINKDVNTADFLKNQVISLVGKEFTKEEQDEINEFIEDNSLVFEYIFAHKIYGNFKEEITDENHATLEYIVEKKKITLGELADEIISEFPELSQKSVSHKNH